MEASSVLSVLVIVALCSQTHSRVVSVGTPVVFTNNNGGGGDEVQAPNGGTATKLFYAGGNVNEAWYTPLDNINDLSAISSIDVQTAGNYVQLVVRGYNNARNGRVRIKLYADIQ